MSKIIVEKRNGTEEDYNQHKIYSAIMNAMKFGSGIVKENVAIIIAQEITKQFIDLRRERVSIERDIEPLVFAKLVEKKETITARMYEAYRAKRELQRTEFSLDKEIEGIVNGSNEDERRENSNKNPDSNGTQRDLIAGVYSRNYSRRKKLPVNVLTAHDESQIHFHDTDYYMQYMHNCSLDDLEDMLTNGTVINGKLIETPKSFQTACTVATQIVQQIANGQYGGQTISLSHLAPFVRISYEKIKKDKIEEWEENGFEYSEKRLEKAVMKVLRKEVASGVQTIQYQVNTFSTSNGWW